LSDGWGVAFVVFVVLVVFVARVKQGWKFGLSSRMLECTNPWVVNLIDVGLV
jgi:hypothetical protein